VFFSHKSIPGFSSEKGAFRRPHSNTSRSILGVQDVLVYHFHLSNPVVTTAYVKKLRYIV
jgi:hypothetical protein